MYAAGKTSLLLAAMCCFTGCTKTIEINQYPPFYTTDLRSVAVLPFDNDTLDARAGQYLTERLAKSLRINGTYEIAGPRELTARLGAKQLKKLPPFDRQAAVKLIGQLDDTQAFIIGTVTTFTSAGYNYRWRNRGYGFGYGLGYGYGYGYPRYGYGPYWRYSIDYHPFYSHNEGRLRARAVMVLISDGKIVSETAVHLGETVFSDGDPPRMTPDECLVKAAGRVVNRLVKRFAVVRRRVKIPLDKALRTALGRDGDKWRLTDRFDADGEGIHAVVSLPPLCHGNRFRLEVIETGRSEVLIHKEFVWSNRQREYELVITPDQLGESPGGRRFVITLYSQSEPIKSRKITIK
ncbi:MAG: hypothetical protein QGH60_11235 [Phycisphaerae bacterium]|jgi:hypothetical protein|nr:hypothetical protein [Phycisphaerae bacterium]